MHTNRFITTLNDPYKQGQYSNMLKTLQEERGLLQELESALDDIMKGPAATSSRPSQVSGTLRQLLRCQMRKGGNEQSCRVTQC
jgi:hypothetical protein